MSEDPVELIISREFNKTSSLLFLLPQHSHPKLFSEFLLYLEALPLSS